MIYDVIRKSDGNLITSYAAQAAAMLDDYPSQDFEHSPRPDDVEEIVITTKFDGRRILTKLEFRSLFSPATLKWIDRFEAQFENYAYLTDDQKDTIRTAFADYHEATQVDLDDPRWEPGLGLYVAIGGMDQDEVTEVLRG